MSLTPYVFCSLGPQISENLMSLFEAEVGVGDGSLEYKIQNPMEGQKIQKR